MNLSELGLLHKDTEHVKTEVQLFGERLERLGKALQNQDTPMTELSFLAHECGMVLRLGLSPMSEVSSDGGEPGIESR